MAEAGIDQADGRGEQVGLDRDAKARSGSAKGVSEPEGALVVLVQGDQRQVVQVVRGHHAMLGQRTFRRDGQMHAQSIGDDLQFMQVVLGFDDTQIELALRHPVADLRRAEGLQGELAGGVVVQIIRHDPGHRRGREPWHAAEGQLAGLALTESFRELAKMLDRRQYFVHPLGQMLGLRGQFGTVVVAPKKQEAHFLLEIRDGGTDRRLAELESARRLKGCRSERPPGRSVAAAGCGVSSWDRV